MEFNWHNIRTYNNSQNNAFEELVCQLAREEEIPNKSSFYRIAPPDGGVEAYALLQNGDEYGWQAKYFFSIKKNQWLQLDRSFKTALEKHPKLVKYYICLPIDREYPKVNKQKWFMDKWISKVEEWKKYASNNDREIEFEYWGSSELIHRLSLDKHSGRLEFWFNGKQFTSDYFNAKVQSSVDDLDNRYTPELNFDLDIAQIFDGLARDGNFKKRFNDYYFDVVMKLKETLKSMERNSLVSYRETLEINLIALKKQYSEVNFFEMEMIPYEKFHDICDKLNDEIDILEKKIKEIEENLLKSKQKRQGTNEEDYNYYKYELRKLDTSIYNFQEFLGSSTATLANNPILILKGEAGVGKSHLLADIALKRSERSQTSLLFLGQHFTSDNNPWTQIINNLLRINVDEYKLLQILEARGQADGSRVVVFIDALNEGRGRYFWKDNIRSFINIFSKYRWIGLVLSIRTSYVRSIAPQELIPLDKAVRETHWGFRDVEYDATKLFFKNYHIEQPSMPLLHPEFQNPLFLKIFCEGLYKAGITKIPEGYEGITKIIDFYTNSINKRMSEFNRLDYPESVNLVLKTIMIIIRERLKTGSRYLKYNDVFPIIEKEFRQYSDKNRFLDELISEGVITRNPFWDKSDKEYDVIFITYERFEDHFFTSFLLQENLNRKNPKKCFQKNGALYEFIKDESTCSFYQGVIESLCIQLPELIGMEFFEVAPHCKGYYQVIEAFIESLIWRRTSTLSMKLKKYFNEYVFYYKGTTERMIDTLLLISSNPNHLFNADFLHNTLEKYSLSDRDAWWTIYLHEQYKYRSSSRRIIDWASSDEERTYISDESIRLMAKTLTWFLTSSNRYLRDETTKALVVLLRNKLSILIKILEDFKNVNDPYVVERLYAVAYGCSLRTNEPESLVDLSHWIYKNIFSIEYVYPHVLMRDYARNIIEYALYLKLPINVDQEKIKPPYKSKVPENIPSDNDIKKLEFDYKAKDFKDYFWAQNSIINSMQPEHSMLGSYGDFGRYVFQSAFRRWPNLDAQKLSNIVVNRVFELGYDVEKHGRFDRLVNWYSGAGRSDHKAERIGKKYQWIAFHELLSQISDNILIEVDPWSKEEGKEEYIQFEGPWDHSLRDIDPTIFIQNTKKEMYEQHSLHWWFNEDYNNWDMDNADWIIHEKDLPNTASIISVKDAEGVEWLMLAIQPIWREPKPRDEERRFHSYKDIWYGINSYLFSLSDTQDWINWASKQNFYGNWMPKMSTKYNVFNREYYWAPAYDFFEKPYYGGNSTRTVTDRHNKRIFGELILTTESYGWEKGFDCSIEDTIMFNKPTNFIFNKMNMHYSEKEGHLYNNKDNLICFDPSIYTKSISCLLVRKQDFITFLNENDLGIFWTIVGEKMIVGGNLSRDDYLGRLIINGYAYLAEDKKVVSKLKPYSESPY